MLIPTSYAPPSVAVTYRPLSPTRSRQYALVSVWPRPEQFENETLA